MKYTIFILTFLVASIGFAQDSTDVTKVTPPKIVTKLHFGASVQFEDIRLKFVEVVQDSRCPKAVQCIWAGEVIVLVDVFKNGNKVEQKKLTINPTFSLQEQLGNLFSSEALSISGISVMPYPVANNKIPMEDYYIQLDVRK
ncbi:hypothetical protein FG167_06095 [Lacinutrix sp. WUR7]|uniref:hypothetical protein n=1 Tax=Lacinutrix sp. WUR7 TaxID=2653681 RepID=UPI00193EC065|nr:hypothetical protein [Lacinutrix sp. WUR7]QRM88820.1 hypothetical protein FG167_06095 [Lacinutrix sp. WUR7]